MRRVVVTGIGLLTPYGLDTEVNWSKITSSISGIRKVTKFDPHDVYCKVGGEIPSGTDENAVDISDHISIKEQRRMDGFIQYAIIAARQAVNDAGWVAKTEEESYRAGCCIGSGIGGVDGICKSAVNVHKHGAKRLTAFFVPANIINSASGYVSVEHKLAGPNTAVVTACASGSHAIGDAANIIKRNEADIMLAGGAEFPLNYISFAGFCALKALAHDYNHTPELASRPWDKNRTGFVLGEGAGVLVLEEYEKAKKRNAKIYCEVLGYGMSGDAHHITAPHPDGSGAFRAMSAALKSANINKEDIGYINAHGTSTQLGDIAELTAIEKLFGNNPKLAISSTKSAIGHMLGAAGSVEAIYSILALTKSVLPPTLNLDMPDTNTKFNLVPKYSQDKKLDYVMSNSFGFGGTNACLIFAKI